MHAISSDLSDPRL